VKKLLLLLLTALVMAACSFSPAVNTQPAAPEIDISNLATLSENYILPVIFLRGATQESWSNAEELLPDNFITMYGYSAVWSANIPESEIENENEIPYYYEDANKLEDYVQHYFDVSTEHLRKATEYSPERNAYRFNMSGVGFVYDPQVLRAEYDNATGELLLHIDSGYEETRSGEAATLTIKIDDNGFTYVGNVRHE